MIMNFLKNNVNLVLDETHTTKNKHKKLVINDSSDAMDDLANNKDNFELKKEISSALRRYQYIFTLTYTDFLKTHF